ncbi:MAG: hypothetical protein IKI01_00485 [Lachnospiraceae bacterium]|nr:hypothetical protein [Lachnospiraceae bacterium]
MKIRCLFGHKWNGCICERCGETRDEGHSFQVLEGSCKTKCIRCGADGPGQHKWNRGGNGCKCTSCGATRNTTDLNAHNFPYVYDPHHLVTGAKHRSCTCADCGWCDDKFGHVYDYSYEPGSSQHKGVCTICGKTIMSRHNFNYGICTYCGYKPGIDLRKTVIDFATYTNLGLDDSVLDEMEQKLLAEGDSAEEVIFNFLAECSYGGVGNIRWWAQAKRLTRMLSKFKSPEVRRHLQQLVDNANRSNSHEYHSEIANVAKEELNKQMGKRI